MNLKFTVTGEELSDILLNIAPTRPVFIWGAPGIVLFDKQNPKTVKHGKTRKLTGNTQEKAHFKRIFKDHNGTK